VPEHDIFYVVRQGAQITVLHEVPADAEELGRFADPVMAIDFAQQEVRRLNADGGDAEYVDPPDDLVGAG
jgi:hypothetical protein